MASVQLKSPIGIPGNETLLSSHDFFILVKKQPRFKKRGLYVFKKSKRKKLTDIGFFPIEIRMVFKRNWF
jgi:hypothetical protein